MRKLTFGVANSLDNYVARPDGAVDWLLWSDEVTEIMTGFWRTIDTLVMGRKTYEAALKHGGGSHPYRGVKTYVFSRTYEAGQHPGVETVRDDAAQFVRKLKAGEGKDICLMGGGELAKPLFEADLIDEVGVNIHPVLLGAGVPLFHQMERQINLALVEHRVLRTNCVYLLYRVVRD